MTTTIALPARLSETDVTTCEACWRGPVDTIRVDADGRALLCLLCAQGGYPRRVDLFPPLGIRNLPARLVGMSDGKHGGGTPQTPPDQGPPLPTPAPAPTPGRPPV
jgi:hypothetical protein